MTTPSFILRLRRKGWKIGPPKWLAASHTGKPTQYRRVKSPRMHTDLDIEAKGLTETQLLSWERYEVGTELARNCRNTVMRRIQKALIRNPDLEEVTVKLWWTPGESDEDDE